MKAAIWTRVSTTQQETANQARQLWDMAERRGWEVVQTYQVEASAFQGAHLKALYQVAKDARRHGYQILLVWALDRLSREGPLATLEIVHRFGKQGVLVVSYQEPWTEVGGEMMDLLLAITGWVARQESQRRSERTRAGLERARANGKVLGRPKGRTDSRKRRTAGYYRRYAS